jgi:hypothetical protein
VSRSRNSCFRKRTRERCVPRVVLRYFGDQMCVETDENDTKSWNGRPSGDTIESTDRMGGRNTIYLGNVGE